MGYMHLDEGADTSEYEYVTVSIYQSDQFGPVYLKSIDCSDKKDTCNFDIYDNSYETTPQGKVVADYGDLHCYVNLNIYNPLVDAPHSD